jgi:head-tail adaptor
MLRHVTNLILRRDRLYAGTTKLSKAKPIMPEIKEEKEEEEIKLDESLVEEEIDLKIMFEHEVKAEYVKQLLKMSYPEKLYLALRRHTIQDILWTRS